MSVLTLSDRGIRLTDPVEVVEAYFHALNHDRVDEAVELLDPDVLYRNTSLPDVRGRRLVAVVLSPLRRKSFGFRVDTHRIAVEAAGRALESGRSVVLTERTDYLRVRGLEFGFWVCGTLEVVDGRITLWHDHFSWEAGIAGLVGSVLRSFVPRRNGV